MKLILLLQAALAGAALVSADASAPDTQYAAERRSRAGDKDGSAHQAAQGVLLGGGSLISSIVHDNDMSIDTADDVDKVMAAMQKHQDEKHTHTYQGLQGMVWPLSVVKSTDDRHPTCRMSTLESQRVMRNAVSSSAMDMSGDNVLSGLTSLLSVGHNSSAADPQIKQSVSSPLRAGNNTDRPPQVNSTLQANETMGANDYSRVRAFYPAPNTTSTTLGTSRWQAAIAKAQQNIARWEVEDLVGLVTGVGWQKGPQPRCVGNIAANDKYDFPGLCLDDSPSGVRFTDLVTVFPAGMTTAATFSMNLTYERARAMGRQFKKKGVEIALVPGMNIHRVPAAGRNWEMGGADPYLSGESSYYTIKGVQDSGVQGCAKHLVLNEQEINRNTYSSNADGRTLHEVYLHPFLRSIQADVTTIMCSYNLVNNSWACQNPELLNNIAKTQFGFAGAIISDWGAQHSGVASANAGLDMTMPGDVCCDPKPTFSLWGPNLTMALQNGSVPEWRVRDMGTRILAGWYLLGQDDPNYPETNFDAFDKLYGEHKNVIAEQDTQIAREVAAAGSVLLKNVNRALPLRKDMRKIAVIGQDAMPAFRGPNVFDDRGGVDGVVGVGWGSGTADYSYLISPYEAMQARARKYGIGFNWLFDNYALGRAATYADANSGVDAAIVFVHCDSGEGYLTYDGNAGDRNNLTLWANGNELIANVTKYQNNTIIVMHTPGQVDLEPWIENENVTAVIQAHMGGSETGNAIADILYGDVNPAGRLPYTIAKNRSDYPADVLYFASEATNQSQLFYTEGLNVDYRHFDANDIQPRFEFGFGLSYTNFSYSNLQGYFMAGSQSSQRKRDAGTADESAAEPVMYNNGQHSENNHHSHSGGASSQPENWNAWPWSNPIPSYMFEDIYTLSFDVKNVGGVDGYEVPQVYLGFDKRSGEPPKVLRKFDRYKICAEETVHVTFKFNRYDLSVWSNEYSRWVKPAGDVAIYVGASSRDIRLQKRKM